LKIGTMYGANHLRFSQTQQIVITLEIMRKIGKTFSSIIRISQLVALDHRAHGTVEQQNTPSQQLFQQISTFMHCHNKSLNKNFTSTKTKYSTLTAGKYSAGHANDAAFLP